MNILHNFCALAVFCALLLAFFCSRAAFAFFWLVLGFKLALSPHFAAFCAAFAIFLFAFLFFEEFCADFMVILWIFGAVFAVFLKKT